jgi:hypothetical protein
MAAARALGVQLVPHDQLLQRTEALVEKLGSRLAQAQRSGGLSFINKEFRRRRLEAQAAGQSFMPFRAVQSRLRKALVEVAAGGSAPIIKRVFGGE